MKRPMIFLFIPLVLGIILQENINIDRNSIILMILILSIFILFIEEKHTYILSLLSILILLGALTYTIKLGNSIVYRNIGNELFFYGRIHSIEKYDEDYSRYIFKIENINNKKVDEKILLKYSGKDKFNIGDKLKFKGKIESGKINTNQKLFNEDKYLKSKNVFGVIKIKSNNILALEEGKKSLKRSLLDYISTTLDGNLHPRNSNLVKSIVRGNKEFLEEDLSIYRALGLSHILAVSGLHIGIISSIFLLIFSNLGINRNITYLLILTTIFIYGYILDFPPSVLRAFLMLCLFYISLMIYEPYDGINSLFFIGILFILNNPFVLYSVGYQLSFMATFSIFYIPSRIKRYFISNTWFDNILIVLISIMIGVLPIQIYYFNRIPVLNIISNLLITPILSIVLSLLLIGLFLNIISLGKFIFSFVNLFLNIQFKILDLLNFIAFKEIKIRSLDLIEIVLLYGIIFIWLNKDDFKNINFNIKKLLGLTIFVSLVVFISPKNQLIVDFIDVGQGDSILIRDGHKNYLIDTGGSLFKDSSIVKYTTIPYLEKEGIFKIDGLFISHYHEDHCEGLPYLLEEFNIKNVFIPHKNSLYFNYIDQNHSKYKVLSKGDRIGSKNLEFKILSSDRNNSNENNNSLVINVLYSGFNLLFTGDMESEIETELLDGMEKVDLIKVPHHGSRTSSTEEFLNNASPDIGIISVGRNNMYGHPNIEVLERYKNIGTRIYRTDEIGRIRVIIDNKAIEVEGYLEEDNRILLKYVFIYIIYFYILYLYTMEYKNDIKELVV